MSGEGKAREVLASCYLNAGGSAEIAEAVRQDDQCLIKDSVAIAAMLAFREEGRLAALDEAAGVARGWPHHPAAIEIVRRIEALKDQKS